MFLRHRIRASTFSLSCPSMALSSSAVRPWKLGGGIGGGTAKGEKNGMGGGRNGGRPAGAAGGALPAVEADAAAVPEGLVVEDEDAAVGCCCVGPRGPAAAPGGGCNRAAAAAAAIWAKKLLGSKLLFAPGLGCCPA